MTTRPVEQYDRLRSASHAADAGKIRFFLNARTDVFFERPPEQHDQAMVVAAVERARAYVDAGADGLFAPGLVDIRLIAQLAKASPLPLNVMVADSAPTLQALAEHGVSYGPRPYLMAMKALEDAARAVSAL